MPTPTHYFEFQKRDICLHATALLSACKWDVAVAHAAVNALAPIAALPTTDDKGNPIPPVEK